MSITEIPTSLCWPLRWITRASYLACEANGQKLLDICVKNCGYPFQLQIATKEFLNELVRRFPERPPIRPSRVQLRILEAIEEWRQTICQTSKYKEDLGFIRDMHRLLSYKGYMFPEIRREDAAVLNPSDVSLADTALVPS